MGWVFFLIAALCCLFVLIGPEALLPKQPIYVVLLFMCLGFLVGGWWPTWKTPPG